MIKSLSEIKEIISYLCEGSYPQTLDNVDSIDFTTAQEYARQKYGSFDHSSLDLFDKYGVFKKLKSFLNEIIHKKIILSANRLVKYKNELMTSDSEEDEKTIQAKVNIMANIINTLSHSVRNNLIGDTFEGLLMKEKDYNPGPDLACGIELKTTTLTGHSITLFQFSLQNDGEQISKNINEFIDSIGANDAQFNISFEKTMFSDSGNFGVSPKEELFGDGVQLDFEGQRDFITKKIGSIVCDEKEIGEFLFTVVCNDDSLVFRIEGSADDAVCTIYKLVIPFRGTRNGFVRGIGDRIDEKLKNVFHVKGVTGTTTDTRDTYVMFTGYESMMLKTNGNSIDNYTIKELILKGVLKPFFRASLKSAEFLKPKKGTPIDKSQQSIDFNQEPQSTGIDVPNNLKRPLQQTIDFDELLRPLNKNQEQTADFGNVSEDTVKYNDNYSSHILNTDNSNVLKVRGVVFKINTKRLNEMFEIERN